MCGIIGVASTKMFQSSFLLERLKRLEYRGYDSFGYYDGSKLDKKTGEIAVAGSGKTKMGIAHTRWATHGGVTVENAHPHMSCDGKIIIAHNGIIENYLDMKKKLEAGGHRFKSQTDSEVAAHYFEETLKKKTLKEAALDFIKEAKGTFAIIVQQEGKNELLALKRDSPMILGIAKESLILASDIYAFCDLTDKAVFFENDEFAIISAGKYEFYSSNGNRLNKNIKKFKWEQEETGIREYPHFMLKEIDEEPIVANRLLFSLDNEQDREFSQLVALIKQSKKIIFAACGTSYHASLLGAYYMHKAGVESQTLIASEFKYYANIDDKTLVIALSQSGETMDVIDALKYAKERHATIASIVNVPHSTIQRMSKVSLNNLAGQEVAVASTKAFTNQVILLLRLAQEFGYQVNLSNVSEKLKKILKQKEELKKAAKILAGSKDCYAIGRGQTYPVAREIALKIKEISYIHAEGMMGGELKHGTMALIEKGTPIISICNMHDNDIISNTKEVEARGARIILITNNRELALGDTRFYIDTDNDGKFALLAAAAGQLLAYYTADILGRPIDKPRNLAKSVTVK